MLGRRGPAVRSLPRCSVRPVIVLMLVLTAPAGLHSDTFADRSRIYAVAYLGGNALFSLICFLKASRSLA